MDSNTNYLFRRKSTAFLGNVEEEFGFSIKTIQTYNGCEFTNDPEVTSKKTIFEQKLEEKGIKLFCVQANCPTSCIDTGSCHK